MDWKRSARQIHDQIRGLVPWPGASTDVLTGQPVKLWAARVLEERTQARPGSVLEAGERGILMACGDGGVLQILELQAPGSRRMKASAGSPGLRTKLSGTGTPSPAARAARRSLLLKSAS